MPPAGTEDAALVRGVSWSALGQIGGEGLRIVTGLGLASFVGPDVFGRMGMVLVFANYAGVLANFGFGAVILQKQDISREELSTIFWVNLALGGALAAAFVGGAPLLAAFYGEPELVWLSRGVGAFFVVTPLGFVQRVLMVKALRFRALAVVEIAAAAVSGVAALALAAAGHAAMGLLAWFLLRGLVTSLGYTASRRFLPAGFSWAAFREMAPFAGNVLGSETLGYFSTNLDRVVVGWWLGDTAVGLLDQASRLALVPVSNIAGVVARVLFPTLARVQADHPRMASLYLDFSGLVLFVCTPLLLGLSATGRSLVALLYGPEWQGLPPVLTWTGLYALTAALVTLSPSMFRAGNRSADELKIRVGRQVLGLAALVAGLPFGLVGVVAGRFAASALTLPWLQLRLGAVCDLPLSAQARTFGPTLGAGAVMYAAVWGVDLALRGLAEGALLPLEVVVGAVVYLGLAWGTGNPSLAFAWRRVRRP